jgi:mitochondrial inner membrane protein COX18
MIARRNALFVEHRCRPWLTMLIPPLTQLPLFVGSSMFISRLSQPPTVFDSESFLTLTSLAHVDPTATLPIALGLITLANVESSRWFISEAAIEREELEQKRVAEKRAQGHIVLQPQKIVRSGLRLLSVGRILIGALVPGVRTRSSFVHERAPKFLRNFGPRPIPDADFSWGRVWCFFLGRRAVLALVRHFRSFTILGV